MEVFGERERRDKQILIRVSSQEKERLEGEAARLEITASELIRRAVNAYLPTRKKTSKK